jgi:hypothetical protein
MFVRCLWCAIEIFFFQFSRDSVFSFSPPNYTYLLPNMQWTDKDDKLLRTMSFPAILSTPVDASKIRIEVLRDWVERTITALLGVEDDICIEYVFELLQAPSPDGKTLDGKKICIMLTGFLVRAFSNEKGITYKIVHGVPLDPSDLCAIRGFGYST